MVAEITFPAGIVIGRKEDDPAEYRGGNHTARERARFWALIEEVGFQRAIEICDYFIPWRKGIRPPQHILMEWVWDHFDGKGEPDDKARNYISRLLPKFASSWHLGVVQFGGDTLREMLVKIRARVEAGEEMPSGYSTMTNNLFNNMNYGIQYGGHGAQSKQPLTHIGNNFFVDAGKPPPRKLRNRANENNMTEAEVRQLGRGD